ncbi:PREDICTED: vesicle transport through interaction with t-SNAREs homolog 1B [Ceratosolen solmsi marchali]|uniref:Vesicle transport through interaction with t-SNAREs homolog 1B n=1 Tax=Ceratosolen solmsi marchali TaxID=326594 RepID=A0AAJ6YTN1_9HYME|nr:PREDICTED: vesicle transport through interaction with t-SNAREs homolog 1B [Ceratosolen solmsi marchali]
MNSDQFAQQRVLLDSRAAIERSNQSVAKSQAISIQTEQIGTEVISELGEQRESLLRTKSRIIETDQELNKSNKILITMKKRILTNKLVLILIILLEIAILGCTVYIKFFKKAKK